MNMRNWKAFCSAAVISGVLWILPAGLAAQEAVFDSDTISGLGARNIGSAAMSGRIAAVTAVKEDGRLTVYVGAGESWTRNSVSVGDGIYKSTDGGENWTNVGLKDSECIAKILIDPK